MAATGGELTPAAEAPAPVVAEVPAGDPDEPIVVSGPQVTPDGVGGGPARDPGGWGDLGTGGVVVRGGSIGDDDHCEIRPPHGRTRQTP